MQHVLLGVDPPDHDNVLGATLEGDGDRLARLADAHSLDGATGSALGVDEVVDVVLDHDGGTKEIMNAQNLELFSLILSKFRMELRKSRD